jgi:DNA-directed RNA polymerase subunit beta'
MSVIKVLDVNDFARGLTPVTSTEMKTRSGEFNEKGLFSEDIFGAEGSLDRAKKFSFINLSTKVVHPTLYRHLIRLERKLEKWFSTEESFTVNDDGSIVEDENGVTGISTFIELFPKIKFRGGGSGQREDFIKGLKHYYKNDTLFIDKIPVLPPDVRPIFEDESGQITFDELNTVYIDVLRKSFQIKSAGSSGPFFDLLNWGLQIAIINHDKFIKKKIEKKHGLIRGNMLGKRLDFSGRAVIIPGPGLDINEIGLPLRLVVQVFQPFLLHYLLFSKKYPHKEKLSKLVQDYTDSELSVDSLQRVFKSIKANDEVTKELYQLIFDASEIVMKGRVVIAKRDPALHDGSLRAFNPILVNGDSIEISTLQVASFNADFDGDQMAIYHPITVQAQQEVKDKMMRLEGSKNTRSVNFEFGKEMVVGLYMLTKNVPLTKSPITVTAEDLEKATDPYIAVKFRGHETTMGKAIFNYAFPSDFRFINDQVDKKLVNSLIPEVLNKYNEQVTMKVFSKLEKIAFKFATIMAPTLSIDMFSVPDSIKRIKDKLKTASPDEGFKLIADAEEILKDKLKGTTLYDLIDSGSSKGWGQPSQMFIAKGVTADPKGKVLTPIAGSFTDGLTTKEFFKASSGARKGMVDRALNTADTGYFTRQLVFLLNSVEAHPTLKDCGTKRTVMLRLEKDMIARLTGRYIVVGNKVVPFNTKDFRVGQSINLRTPIFCESKKICHTCYGELLKRTKTPYVGMIAGSAIGERGTQLIMRTFHTGGAATAAKHNVLQEIIDNDPIANLEK